MGKISLADIKNEIARSGANKGKIVYFKQDSKVRLRFLVDLEEGIKIPFHDSFKLSVNVPCQEVFGRECPYCDDMELRTRQKFCWPVYDYEAKEVKLLLEAVNQCSPVNALAAYYEEYGTLTDRDYVITQKGAGTSKVFTIIPQEKRAFRNPKAKALSEKAMLQIIAKAYPPEDGGSALTDEEEKMFESDKYSALSAKQAYIECKKRGIDVPPRKEINYYIKLLEEDDSQNSDGWDDEDDNSDDWGDVMNVPDDVDDELPFN